MTPAAFRLSLKGKTPPAGVCAALQALWWAANENWNKAHRIVMNEHDQSFALGCTPICIASKAIWIMPVIGIDRRGANQQRTTYRRNGMKSSRRSL